ncbi:MAG: hypothetical protein HC912_06640 [Saprospiraceae bacterium]|nr:hypothetical protein [Saprospiraceae bacterium]
MTQEITRLGQNKLVQYGIGTVLLAGTAIGSFFLIKRIVDESRIRRDYNDAADPAKAASYAIRLHNAFENKSSLTHSWFGSELGTDEEAVYQTLTEIPSRKMLQSMMDVYNRDFGEKGFFMERLAYEMDGPGEFDKALQIIHSKQ